MSPGVDTRLLRSRRLVRRTDFTTIAKSSVGRSRDELFAVQAVLSERTHARLGVTVGRRVSLKAVARNRIKRQIRESFRQHQYLLTGLDIVVTAQAPANTKLNAQLRHSLSQHWERVAQACRKSRSPS
jgi:ribonuclease P protein component